MADPDFGDEDRCPASPEGEHVPDPKTITPAEDFEFPNMVVDVNCKYCGRSGSIPVDPSDVNW